MKLWRWATHERAAHVRNFSNTLHSFLLLIRLLLARLHMVRTLNLLFFLSLTCFIIQPRHPTPPSASQSKTVKIVNPPPVKPRAISLG